MRLTTSLLLALSSAAPIVAQAGPPELRFAAKKGDHARFRVHTSLDQTPVGVPSYDLTKELELRVLDVGAKGDVSVQLEVLSVKGKIGILLSGSVEIDSTRKFPKDERTGPLSPASVHDYATRLVKKPIRATIAADGSKVTIKDAKQLLEEARRGMPAFPRSALGNVSAITLTEEIASLIGRVPGSQGGAGSWPSKSVSEFGALAVVVTHTHRLLESDPDSASLACDGTVEKADKATLARLASEDPDPEWTKLREGAPFTVLDKSHAQGRCTLSRKDGMVISSETTLVIVATLMGNEVTRTEKRSIERIDDPAPAPDSRPKQK